ncbi:MAG: hypothetical protein ACTHU0_13980 [Kofleriaceae bacterium]
MEASWDERLAAASAARLALFQQIGTPSSDVIAPLIGPALTGGPSWPSRPAWRLIQRDDSVVLISDGLSDPWEEEEGAGFGLEVYVEVDAAELPGEASLTDVARSWLFAAVSEISNVIAGHGGVRALIEELGTVSVEVSGERFPEALRNEHGRVGVLLGVPARDLPQRVDYAGGGDAMLVAITVLALPELERIVAEGDEARREIAEHLASQEHGHRSRLDRAPVVEAGEGEHAEAEAEEVEGAEEGEELEAEVEEEAEPAAKAKQPAKKAKAAAKKAKPTAKKAKQAAKAGAKKAKPAAKAVAAKAGAKKEGKKPAAKAGAKKAAGKTPAAKAGAKKAAGKKPAAKAGAKKAAAKGKPAAAKAKQAARKQPAGKKSAAKGKSAAKRR